MVFFKLIHIFFIFKLNFLPLEEGNDHLRVVLHDAVDGPVSLHHLLVVAAALQGSPGFYAGCHVAVDL
jgi:hypothetical protein